MVAIPANTPVTISELQAWYQLKAEIARMQLHERVMRTRIVKHFVPNPVEGMNTVALADEFGSELKVTQPIDRKVDPAALAAIRDKLREAGIVVENVIEHKPELRVGNYRKLADEQKHLLDQCLVVKPGMPQVDIVVPKKPKV